ncbi:hypothetical protein [Flavobacterium sp.]|uniref:hypothetical protein n=1 Tax=Flavobacterium sp. TaxID=239 RepID=UPI0037BF6A98
MAPADDDIVWDDEDITWDPPASAGPDLKDPANWRLRAKGVARALAAGASANWADEAEAVVGAADSLSPVALGQSLYNAAQSEILGTPSRYKTRKAAITAEQNKMREAFPGAMALTELGGGLAPALATRGKMMPGPNAAAPVLAKAPGPLRRILRGAGLGAGAGAIAGAGAGEGGAVERGIKAVEGALVGTGVGGLITTGMSLAPAVYRVARNAYRGGLPSGEVSDAADGLVLDALASDEVTLTEAQRRLADVRRAGVGGSTLADVSGPNAVGRLSASANSPGAGRTEAQEMLRRRAEQQGAGLRADAVRASGVPRQDTNALMDTITQRMRDEAAPAYAKAYAGPLVDDPRVLGMLDLPAFREGRARAANMLAAEGRELDMNVRSVEVLDQIKRGLDDVIRTSRGENGKATELTRIYTRQKNEFLAALDEAAPDYALARKQFAGEMALRDAVEKGRSVLGLGHDDWRELAKDFDGMTAGEKNMLLRGLVDDMALRFEKKGQVEGAGGPDLTPLLTSVQTSQRLKKLLPSPEAYDTFMTAVLARRRQSEVRSAVAFGSRTTPLAMDMAAISENPIKADWLSSLVRGNPVPLALGSVSRNVADRLGGVTRQVNAEIARALTLTGPELDRYLRSLDPKRQQLVLEGMRRAANSDAAAVGGAVGTTGLLQPRER